MKNSSAAVLSPADQTLLENMPHFMVTSADVQAMMDRYQFSDDTRRIIEEENLLPAACWTAESVAGRLPAALRAAGEQALPL